MAKTVQKGTYGTLRKQVDEFATKHGVSFVTVYTFMRKHKLDRLPTDEEFAKRQNRGRPRKERK